MHRAQTCWKPALACVALAMAAPSAAAAQAQHSTSVIFVYEAGTTIQEGAIISMGLRRGIREVEGVRFMHPVDTLTQRPYVEEVEDALQELDPIADMVRTGDAEYAFQRADELVELFERNLVLVHRAQLVDAYMLSAVGRCRAGRRRPCQNRMAEVIAFREGLTYDAERYGHESQETFDLVRQRTINGGRGTLVVETEPPGAEVYIDGRSYGPSPVRADGLLGGGHYVTIKEINHLKQILRVEVRAARETTEQIILEPNPEARLVASERIQNLLRGELGEPRAQETIRSVGRRLGTQQLIIGVLRPAAGNTVHAQLYLYHMHTLHLQAQAEATLTIDEAGMDQAAELAQELYQGVDLEGGIDAPEDTTEIVAAQPEIYEQWWFWLATVGGAAVIAAGIIGGSLVADGANQGPPSGFFRFDLGRLP